MSGDLGVVRTNADRLDVQAQKRCFGEIYADLRRVARAQLRRLPGDGALTATGLVHETFVKLFSRDAPQVNDHGHLLAIALRAMRMILIDATRERLARKRGGGAFEVEFSAVEAQLARVPSRSLEHDGLALDQALERLADLDGRLARVVKCRFFAGMTEEQAGAALGVTARTIRRDWCAARSFLRRELEQAA